jgi:hypothetical protein
MARYHINPKTGNPGICRATKVCPFGDLQSDHYSSTSEARDAYETQQKGSFRRKICLSDPKDVLMDFEAPDKMTERLYREYLTLDSHPHVGAIRIYTTSGSSEINEYLRSDNLPPDGDWIIKNVSQIDTFFSDVEAAQRHVYRLVDRSAVEGIMSGGEKDFHDPAFLSTTESIDTVIWMARTRAIKKRHDSVLLEMVTNHGISLQSESKARVGTVQSFENEVLLDRGLEFKVEGTVLHKKLQLMTDRQDLGRQFSQSRGYYTMNDREFYDKNFTAGSQISIPTIQLTQK